MFLKTEFGFGDIALSLIADIDEKEIVDCADNGSHCHITDGNHLVVLFHLEKFCKAQLFAAVFLG